MDCDKFKILYVIEFDCRIPEGSQPKKDALTHSINEIVKIFVSTILTTLTVGNEKLLVRIGRVDCAEADKTKKHTCIQKVKLELYEEK